MKIFWSWQSDTPGSIGRHFVKASLEAALKELNQEPTVEESDRPDPIELDYGRKGVAGSPDLAATILKKIEDSKIFVADVTPVGATADGKKAILNPNVAIELGYSLATVGDGGLLMVLNTHYGHRETLPFDLRHKAGPIMYELEPGADKEKINRVQTELTWNLKVAIRECLQQVADEPSAAHVEVPQGSNVAQYFQDNEVLAVRANMGALELSYEVKPLLYLRLIPTYGMPPLREAEINQLIYGIKLTPLGDTRYGGSKDRNKYGGMTYDSERPENGELFTSSQIFENRELWGIDATVFDEDEKYIASEACEQVLCNGLWRYIEFATDYLQLVPPVIIEAGACRVKGFRLATRDNPRAGRIVKNEICVRQTLVSFEAAAVERTLLAIFEKFYDAAGIVRPNELGLPERQK